MASNSKNKLKIDEKMTSSNKLELSDCTCPICMYILIEPVTMPCGHELCMPCFETNVQETSLLCPMCRLRIASWARRATRNKKLINVKRWEEIQIAFPRKVKCRLEGREDEYSSNSEEDLFIGIHQLAEKGEIRREYEEEMKKLQEERDRQQKEEEVASHRLIQDLQAEEFAKQLELERQALSDEALARELTQRLNKSSSTPSRTISSTSTITKTPTVLDKFIQKSTTTEGRNKNNNSASLQHTVLKQDKPDPYPFKCYSPTHFGKIISSEMVTTDTYPYVDIKAIDREKKERGKDKHKQQLDKSAEQSILDYIFIDSRPQSPSGCAKDKFPSIKLEMEKDHQRIDLKEDQVKDKLAINDTKDTYHSNVAKKSNLMEWLRDSENKLLTAVNASIATMSQAKDGKDTHLPDLPTINYSSAMDDEESNSIDTELNYFKPVKSFPKTPPRCLPSGDKFDPPVIKSTPRNLKQVLLTEGCGPPENLNPAKLGGSPTMQRRILELQAMRQVQVNIHSKGTSTTTIPGPSSPVLQSKLNLPGQSIPSSSNTFMSPKPLVKNRTTLLELCKRNATTNQSVTAESTVSIDISLGPDSSVFINDSSDEDDDGDIEYMGTSQKSPSVIVEDTHKEPLLPILPLEHSFHDDMLGDILDYTDFTYSATGLPKDEPTNTTVTAKSETISSVQQTTHSTGQSEYLADAFITSENTRSDAANLSFKFCHSDATTQSSLVSTTGVEPKRTSFSNAISPLKVNNEDQQDIFPFQTIEEESSDAKDMHYLKKKQVNEESSTVPVSPGKVYRMKRVTRSTHSKSSVIHKTKATTYPRSEQSKAGSSVKSNITMEGLSNKTIDIPLDVPTISPEVHIQNWLLTNPQIEEHSYSKLTGQMDDSINCTEPLAQDCGDSRPIEELDNTDYSVIKLEKDAAVNVNNVEKHNIHSSCSSKRTKYNSETSNFGQLSLSKPLGSDLSKEIPSLRETNRIPNPKQNDWGPSEIKCQILATPQIETSLQDKMLHCASPVQCQLVSTTSGRNITSNFQEIDVARSPSDDLMFMEKNESCDSTKQKTRKRGRLKTDIVSDSCSSPLKRKKVIGKKETSSSEPTPNKRSLNGINILSEESVGVSPKKVSKLIPKKTKSPLKSSQRKQYNMRTTNINLKDGVRKKPSTISSGSDLFSDEFTKDNNELVIKPTPVKALRTRSASQGEKIGQECCDFVVTKKCECKPKSLLKDQRNPQTPLKNQSKLKTPLKNQNKQTTLTKDKSKQKSPSKNNGKQRSPSKDTTNEIKQYKHEEKAKTRDSRESRQTNILISANKQNSQSKGTPPKRQRNHNHIIPVNHKPRTRSNDSWKTEQNFPQGERQIFQKCKNTKVTPNKREVQTSKSRQKLEGGHLVGENKMLRNRKHHILSDNSQESTDEGSDIELKDKPKAVLVCKPPIFPSDRERSRSTRSSRGQEADSNVQQQLVRGVKQHRSLRSLSSERELTDYESAGECVPRRSRRRRTSLKESKPQRKPRRKPSCTGSESDRESVASRTRSRSTPVKQVIAKKAESSNKSVSSNKGKRSPKRLGQPRKIFAGSRGNAYEDSDSSSDAESLASVSSHTRSKLKQGTDIIGRRLTTRRDAVIEKSQPGISTKAQKKSKLSHGGRESDGESITSETHKRITGKFKRSMSSQKWQISGNLSSVSSDLVAFSGQNKQSNKGKSKLRSRKTDMIHDDKENSMDSVDKLVMHVEEGPTYQKSHLISQDIEAMVQKVNSSIHKNTRGNKHNMEALFKRKRYNSVTETGTNPPLPKHCKSMPDLTISSNQPEVVDSSLSTSDEMTSGRTLNDLKNKSGKKNSTVKSPREKNMTTKVTANKACTEERSMSHINSNEACKSSRSNSKSEFCVNNGSKNKNITCLNSEKKKKNETCIKNNGKKAKNEAGAQNGKKGVNKGRKGYNKTPNARKITQTTLTFVTTNSEDEFENENVKRKLTFVKVGYHKKDNVIKAKPQMSASHLVRNKQNVVNNCTNQLMQSNKSKISKSSKNNLIKSKPGSKTECTYQNQCNKSNVLDKIRKEHSHFQSEFDYQCYLEEQDRLLAVKLQADFDLEAKLRLNAIRVKGSEDEYSLRRKKKS